MAGRPVRSDVFTVKDFDMSENLLQNVNLHPDGLRIIRLDTGGLKPKFIQGFGILTARCGQQSVIALRVSKDGETFIEGGMFRFFQRAGFA